MYPYSNFTIPIWNERTIYIKDIEFIIYAELEALLDIIETDNSRYAQDHSVFEKLKIPKERVDDRVYVLYIKEKYGFVNIVNASLYSAKQVKKLIDILKTKDNTLESIVRI